MPDAARKAVAHRQEVLEAAKEKLLRGDRLMADGDVAGGTSEYRAAFRGAPDFAMGQSLRLEAFAKYQLAARQYGDKLAQNGRLQEAQKLIEDVFKDAQEAGLSPRAVDEETKRLMADLRKPEVYNPAVTAMHVDRVKEVEKALQTAEGAFRIGDFDEANKQYALVLGIDPTNSAARRGLQNVEKHINTQYYDAARDHTRAKMLNQVTQSWENPVQRVGLKDVQASAEALAGKPAQAGSLQEKLRTLILPEVEFAETPLREALVYLTNRSRQLDPSGKGVNIVLRAREESAGSKPVTFTLRGAPLEIVIDYVGRMVGMDYRVDDFAVTLVPTGDLSTTALILKTYRVPPGFLSEGALPDQSSPTNDPFASPSDKGKSQTLQPRLSAKEFLEKNGVTFPPGGAAQFNAESSTLMVRNTQDQLDLVEMMVQNSFGDVTKLLRIMVKAIDIGANDLQEAGFDWLMGAFGVTDRVQLGGGTFGTTSAAGDYPMTDASGNPIPGMPVTSALRSGDYALKSDSIESIIQRGPSAGTSNARAPGFLSATGTLTNPQFQTVLRAVSQHKGSDGLLSSGVVVRAGQTAIIKNVREFIYPTDYDQPQVPNSVGNVGTVVSLPITPPQPRAFQTREVGAQMQVEGNIAADGYSIHMTLTPEIVEFEGFVDYGAPIVFASSSFPNRVLMPIFNTKRVNVQVDVYDGHTLVIGGLLQERVEHINDKVPGLGDAPFVGQFFRQKSERTQKRAILFFVTPTIIDPAGTPVRNPAESVQSVVPKGNS